MTDERLRQELDSDQYKAVTAPLSNMLCIANAGSGKTRVLTYRIAHWIDQGTPESHFMMLTFTNKAAREMIDRIRVLLNRSHLQITGGTFHSVANRLLHRYANHIEWSHNFTVMNESEAKKLLGLCRERYCAENDINRKEFPTRDILHAFYSYCRNKRISLNDGAYHFSIDRGLLRDCRPIFADYEARKRKSNCMDFDDLLEQFDALLDNPYVGKWIRENTPHIFVDEYQDINCLQDSIIHKLTSSPQTTITAVGDEAQCIYGFRGSEVQFINNFKQDYPNASVFPIRNNYRSTEAVVSSALSVINESPIYMGAEKEMFHNRPEDIPVSLVRTSSEWSQSNFIADSIARIHASGVDYGNIAVLSRTNNLPKSIELVLNERHIPVTMNCGIPFFDREHIGTIMDYLKFLLNPSNELAFWNLFETAEGIGPKTSRKMFEAFERGNLDISQLESLKTPAKATNHFSKIVQAIQDGAQELFISQDKANIQALIHFFYDGYFNSRMDEMYKDEAKKRKKDVSLLLTMAGSYESLERFINDAALDMKDEDVEGGKVLITTIHKAKGLEWDYVFIPFVNQGVVPFYKCDYGEDLEEERRLLYVAMTRAKLSLCMSSISQVFDNSYFKPDWSEFLDCLFAKRNSGLVDSFYA